jgi:hypothetical protein
MMSVIARAVAATRVEKYRDLTIFSPLSCHSPTVYTESADYHYQQITGDNSELFAIFQTCSYICSERVFSADTE